MSRHSLVGCLLSLAFCAIGVPCVASEREVLLGAVYKETVFAVPKVEVERPVVHPGITVLQAPLSVEPGKPYTPKRYDFTQGVQCNQPYRWRVTRDMFWGSGSAGARQLADEVQRIPVEELPFHDKTNAKRDEQYRAKYPGSDEPAVKVRLAHSWGADPVGHVCDHHPLAPGDSPNPPVEQPFRSTPGVFFDVCPSPDNNRLQLFVLDIDKIRIWSGTAKWSIDACWNMDWCKEEEAKEVERFPSPFKEAFTVFVRDKDYYFVTEYGDVFLVCPPAKKDEERKVEKVWDGRRQPVHALITDASNDKVYCFVEPFFTDKQDEERVYFELSAKPDPKPYKLKKIEKPKIDEPLKSVLEYAQVLHADGKIKAK